MKFLTNLLLLFSLGIFLSGCLNVNDEIWIESDGSGRFESTTDLSAMYPFLSMGLQQEIQKQEDKEGGDENPMTAFMKNLMGKESIDTVFHFKNMMDEALAKEGMTWDMLLDSLENSAPEEADISEAEKESLMGLFASVSDMKMRMQMDKDASMFKTTTIQDFAHYDERFSMGDAMTEIINLMGDGANAQSPLGGGGEVDEILNQIFGGQTLLDINGDVLRIRRSGIDLSVLGEEFQQNFAMVKMFLGNEPYRMTIHFPGKIKKISSDQVKKIDKKTVMVEIPLNDLFDPEMQLDASIKFKGLKK